MESDKQSPKEEWRRIEISIFDEEAEVVFEVSGNVDRKTAHKFIEGVGFGFIPQELPLLPRAVRGVPLPVKVSCDLKQVCSDYYEKCSECAENKAKSYFKPKEE